MSRRGVLSNHCVLPFSPSLFSLTLSEFKHKPNFFDPLLSGFSLDYCSPLVYAASVLVDHLNSCQPQVYATCL